jgi:hypothetical protein
MEVSFSQMKAFLSAAIRAISSGITGLQTSAILT